MPFTPHMLIPDSFQLGPSHVLTPTINRVDTPGAGTDALGYAVPDSGPVPEVIGLDREALRAVGFTGKVGQALALPHENAPVLIAVGIGAAGALTAATLRDAAAALARAAKNERHLATDLVAAAMEAAALDAQVAASVVVEGVLLARYRYDELKTKAETVPLETLELLGIGRTENEPVASGASRGLTLARAGMLARDLASAPPAYLTATNFADFALDVGAQTGLEVTVFDKAQLIELGCGGLLGVNAGSVEEPRMIQLRYRPVGPATGNLALVGKGITYDAGGLALKPNNAMHAAMKMDMSGAGAVFAAMTALAELGCTNTVTGYLMCTDNLPSGSAIALGDVLRIHGGTTVEVKNPDAEGRLVMADAIVLAKEAGVDAIVDIATLTGAAMSALGTMMAPVFGNDQSIVDQVLAASAVTDEALWQFPLERRYRDQLNSDIADISNLGGPYGGSITAALFLAHFVGETPWAHLDICGPMMSGKDSSWRSKGPTGFGARLLAEFAVAFRP
ncbi:leucyl aminopeptidase family protein [Rathayibacter soli]|uniref:leucyl aminopeptidase family protein n=1 Tax=Rathayibacter soli TaxID=3144168 RepID=UPI0027E42F3F|nr:leucyl aminopeptidase [Glaciibacter superstes]